MTSTLPTVVPPELGYEPIAQQAPMVRSKIKVAPLAPTYLLSTVGNDTLRFRLPSASSQLVLLDSIQFVAQVTNEKLGQTMDPAVGLGGLFSRIVLRSNGTVIQDTQNHDFIQAFLNQIARKPAPYEGMYTGRSGPNGLTNRFSGSNIEAAALKDPTYYQNAVRTAPLGVENASWNVGIDESSVNPSALQTTNSYPHHFNHRFNIGLFEYPYAVPLSLLRDLEIELTINSNANWVVDVGQLIKTSSTVGLTQHLPIGTFTLNDIHLEMDLLVVPDAMSQQLNAELNSNAMAMIPTLQWYTQWQSVQIPANSTLDHTIVLQQVLSSVRAIFVVFYPQPVPVLSSKATSSYCMKNPGYDDTLGGTFGSPTGVRGGGVVSAQLQIQGTSLIPEEPMTNRNRMLAVLRQALLICGLQEMNIETMRDYLLMPSPIMTTAGGSSTTGAVTKDELELIPRTGGNTAADGSGIVRNVLLDELLYGQYGSSITATPARCGDKFVIGFPLASSYAQNNVMNGLKIEHNTQLKLKLQNITTSAVNYNCLIYLASQTIVRLAASGTVDTLS